MTEILGSLELIAKKLRLVAEMVDLEAQDQDARLRSLERLSALVLLDAADAHDGFGQKQPASYQELADLLGVTLPC